MNNNDWQEQNFLDDIEYIEEVNERGQKRAAKGNERKRKWREIENIKEQRRLRRDMAYYEHHAY